MKHILKLLLGSTLIFGCATLGHAGETEAQKQAKPATRHTIAVNAEQAKALDFTDRQDFEDAQRGFIAPLPDNGKILAADGKKTWDLAPYDFLKPAMSRDNPPSRILPTPAPDTVNPSLWRQGQLVMRDGLYKVVDGIYQVRNADISNMTIFEGKTGIIVADPLVSEENAKAALELYYAHRPKKPVKAVIFSHSHADHYGGVGGIISHEDVASGKVQILAPAGFMQAVCAEFLLAGKAMYTRANYMYGTFLEAGPRGHVGAGLGLALSRGTSGVMEPTRLIEKDGETLSIDGLTFIFQLAPNTEAPAEMHWYIPEFKALTTAENCTHTMHNLYTLRGAKTRDPMKWSQALDESLRRFGDRAEVLYSMHHWPVWGRERVARELALMRDLYRYLNDQTLHLANKGLTMVEIAEELRLPDALARHFALRGYYGTLSHNAKSVYNYYLGWFDGNPAHLHVLTPVDAARKYVDYMGGAAEVVKKARADFDRGEYRWVVQVLDHVIFADPANREARELSADAMEQLGYQAESGVWRNFYLTGALELRELPPAPDGDMARSVNTVALSMPAEYYFGYLGVRLDGARAAGKKAEIGICLTDDRENWLLTLENGVLLAHRTEQPDTPTIQCTRREMMALFEGKLPLAEAAARGLLKDTAALEILLPLLDTFKGGFNIVTP